MARDLTDGQLSAIRKVRRRRAELGLKQREAAERAGISLRTLGSFENGHHWPDDLTLSQLERLALEWPPGHISDLAIQHEADESLDVNPSSLVDLAVGRVVTVLRQVPSPQREKAWRDIVANVEDVVFPPPVTEEQMAEVSERVAALEDERQEA